MFASLVSYTNLNLINNLHLCVIIGDIFKRCFSFKKICKDAYSVMTWFCAGDIEFLGVLKSHLQYVMTFNFFLEIFAMCVWVYIWIQSAYDHTFTCVTHTMSLIL